MFPNSQVNRSPDDAKNTFVESDSQDLEEFIYLISHDLRNSVRALVELPQWIREDMDDLGYDVKGALAENMEMMDTQAHRLDKMLVDLLVYSRIGRMQSVENINFTELVTQIRAEVNIPQGFEISQDIQVSTLRIGERDIVTLLMALISNAIKHHDRDHGHISIGTHACPGHIVLSVIDDGPGIAEKYRKQVFEVMKTLKPRDEVEGSGMGLAIVRKVATHYGAQILWPSTASNRGTSLEIWFPES